MNSLLELGSLLSRKRKEAKLSLKKLAAKCGMSDSTLSYIERGKAKAPSVVQVFSVANELSIKPSELFETLGYQTEHSAELAGFLKNVDLLSAEDLRTTQMFIDFLISRRMAGDKGDVKQ